MALLKWDGHNEIRIVTGDEEFDAEHAQDLVVSVKELLGAFNQEQVTDRIVRRLLAKRRSDYETMLAKVPGITTERE